MKNINFNVLFLTLFSISISFSQNFVDISDESTRFQNLLEKSNNGNFKSLNSSDFNGTTLVFKDDRTAILKTMSGDSFKLPNVNYDAYSDRIVTKINKDSIFIYNDAVINYVDFNNTIAKKYLIDNSGSRYLFTLENGEKVSFLKGYIGKVIKGKVNPMTKKMMTMNRLKISNIYFITKNNKTAIEINLKKSNILSILNDKKNEITKFVKSEKLSYKKEEDVIKIIKRYNSL
ncbi:hypothetical protein [Lacinutrix sp. Bg11-31]|uniref:hypothetical protein n=1 Tax=Lacinutrix sp. Bg11-31 TaxID=2057808 RepID=UPI000C305B98|nr:hypothetical protein [Lacinutrix sp. Bg11-31]AUC82308.1 hypothetical protein CW733_09265 [Lacinutrix sp. Bg11-31]